MADPLVLDATCAISLHDSGALEVVLQIAAFDFLIGPIVYGECPEFQPKLDELNEGGLLRLLSDSDISVDVFEAYAAKHGLGDGETECLVLGAALTASVATDDRKARRAVRDEFGEERRLGSIGLLRLAVVNNLITAAEAEMYYSTMRDIGAFLPEIDDGYFNISSTSGE